MRIVLVMVVRRAVTRGPLTFWCLDVSHGLGAILQYADPAPCLQVDPRGRHNLVE
jgi:hypothetical protein